MDQAREIARNMSSMASQAFGCIEVYTGLQPIVFFTVLALLLAAYYLVSGILAPSQISSVPSPTIDEDGDTATVAAPDCSPVVELGDHVTLTELSKYDGKEPQKPLLMAIKGAIYNVSSASDFYGPDGPYSVFAGKDASRAFAKMIFDESDLSGNLDGLSGRQLKALDDWVSKFDSKYPKVGTLRPKKEKVELVDDSSIGEREEKVEKKGFKDSDEKDDLSREKADGDVKTKGDGTETGAARSTRSDREDLSETTTAETEVRDRGGEDNFNSFSAA